MSRGLAKEDSDAATVQLAAHAIDPRAAGAASRLSSHQRRIHAVTALAFAGGLGGGVVFPILPLLGLQLGIAPLLVGLILSLNRITRLLVNPLTGSLVDRFGARWPLTVGLLVEGVATLCFAAGVHGHHAAAWFLAGRALWGVGSSLLMVGALAAGLIYSDAGNRGLASAKVRMALSTGVPAGLVLGGLVSDRYAPGTAFLAAAAITFLGVLVALVIAPRGPDRVAERQERTGEAPTIRGLLRMRPLWALWLLNFFVFFSVQGVILASLVLVLHARHLNVHVWGAEGTSGVLMAMMIGASALVAWFIGKGIDRRPARAVYLLAGVLLLILGFVLLAAAHSTALAAAALTLVGMGLGGINVPLLVIMGDWVAPSAYGRAVGVYQFMGDVGGSLGPIAGIWAMHRYGDTATMLALAGFMLLALPLAGSVWWRERTTGKKAALLA
jgi:MFS family permease